MVGVRVCCVLLAGALTGCGGERAGGDATSPLGDVPSGWSELPAPPEVRSRGAIAWTGDKLVMWGGYVFTGSGDKPTEAAGLVFDAHVGTWEETSYSPLHARAHPASAWTGTELLIWGGTDGRHEQFFGDGAAYDPSADTWRTLPDAPITARAPLAVWTGDELLVWGTAVRVHRRPRDGAAYEPETNTWRTIAEAPIELTDATAVWTGREMIVFGAALHGGNLPETGTAIAAAYDPEADRWRELLDSSLSPQSSTAAWTGRELIAWDYLHGSAALDPRANQWRALAEVPLHSGECSPESVPVGGWILGDFCGLLTRYQPAADRWTALEGPDDGPWGFELVPAERVVLLPARNHETGAERLFAYRP